MPSIFHSRNGAWRAERLAANRGALRFSPVRVEEPGANPARPGEPAVMLTRIDPGGKWAALFPDEAGITHNGQPVPAGLRVLAHGDRIARGGEAVFFSAEEAACVEFFAGSESLSCPRCKTGIAPGQCVVRCPTCGVVHHEVPDRKCWSYGATCTLCPHPTALDTALRWSPETL